MSDQHDAGEPRDALDELVAQLLECGGVLSQLISHMVQLGASGRSAPDAAPIPAVAHSLIRGVSLDLTQLHSEREIRSAAVIVEEMTKAICDEIFVVDPSVGSNHTGAGTLRRRRRRRRPS